MPKKTSKKAKKVVSKKVKVTRKAKPKKAKAKKAKAKKKVVKPVKVAKVLVVNKPFNRAKIVRHLAEAACVQKKDVVAVMDALVGLIEAHLKRRGPGEFTLFGLVKFRVIHKPATKARQGINPFTGEPAVFAAKPARSVVKVKPLKRIKELV